MIPSYHEVEVLRPADPRDAVVGFAGGSSRSDGSDNRSIQIRSRESHPGRAGLEGHLDAARHRTRLRAAFERAGVKNPKWNDSMRALLDQVANLRGGGNLANRKKVEELVRQLHQLGCTDPLFRYLHTRYGDQSTRHEDPSAALRAASQGLRDSDYDALEKFWATYRTASQLKDKSRSKAPQEAVALFRTAVDLLAAAFGNQELLADEVGSTSEELLIALKFDPVEYRAAWDKLVPLMTLHWPNSPHVLLAIGWGHLDRAWMARGNGYANTVTKGADSDRFRI